MWVAVDGGSVLGTVSATIGSDGCYLRGMAVRPTTTRSGVATMLLDTVERHAAERDIGRIWLRTTPFLDAAIALYRRFGFRVIEDPRQSDLFGTPLMTMEKHLPGR